MKQKSYKKDNQRLSQDLFRSLVPTDDADISVYEDALNYAIKNNSISNIAISGNYGSGKSSTFLSYEKKHSELKTMHIELPHYKTYNNSDFTDNNKDASLNLLENKIINQLVTQIPSKKIPLSIFHPKTKFSKLVQLITLVLLGLFAFSIVALFLGTQHNILVQKLNLVPNNHLIKFSFIYFITILFFLIYWFINFFIRGWTIKNFKLGNELLNLQVEKKEDYSYFDRYMSEILYLFENSGLSIFVFEDLDRFDIPLIYERLHEINILANKRKSSRRKKPIKFVYMLKDDSFISKDRSKIFDFIIPIVPIISSNNSYELLSRFVKSLNIKIEKSPLKKLSIFIDDKRLLDNITNEFTIYYFKLGEESNLDFLKLLGLITYKNIFPADFANLQKNKGFVKLLLQKTTGLRNDNINKLNLSLQEQEEELDILKKNKDNTLFDSITELESLYLNFSNIYYIGQKSLNDFKNSLEALKYLKKNKVSARDYYNRDINIEKQFEELQNNKEFQRRKNKLQSQIDNSIDKSQKSIGDIKNNLIKERIKPISELMLAKGNDFFQDLAKTNNYDSILKNSYFDLIPFLFRESIIDEHYYDYIEFFYEGQLSQHDRSYMRKIFENSDNLDPETVIENHDEFLSYLSVGDISKYNIINYDLVSYILLHKRYLDKYKADLITMICNNKETDVLNFIVNSIDSITFKIRVDLLISVNSSWHSFVQDFIKSSIGDNDKSTFIFMVLRIIDSNNLPTGLWNPIDKWLQSNILVFMNTLSDKKSQAYLKNPNQIDDKLTDINILKILRNLGCKLINIDPLSKDQIINCMKYEIVEINIVNIYRIHELFCDYTKPDLSYFISTFKEIKKPQIVDFITEHISEILSSVLQEVRYYRETDKCVTDLLNSRDIAEELKLKLIDKRKEIIDDITSIENFAYLDKLATRNLFKGSSENIQYYILKNDNDYDIKLNKIINNSKEKIVFKATLDKDTRIHIFDSIATTEGINVDKRCEMMSSLHRVYTNYCPENLNEIIEELIKFNIIEISNKNILEFLKSNRKIFAAFVKKDYKNLKSVVKDIEVPSESLDYAIYDSDLEQSTKINIINDFTVSVKLASLNYEKAFVENSLNRNLIMPKEIPELIINIDSFEAKIREKIFELANDYPEEVSSTILDKKSKSLIKALLNNERINLSVKRSLYLKAMVMNLLTFAEIEKYIDTLQYPSQFKNTLYKGRPSVEYTEDNFKLFEALKNANIVTKSSYTTTDKIFMSGTRRLNKNNN